MLGRLADGARFDAALQREGLWPLRAQGIEVLQLNLGKLCNQTCRHCHVDAGPDRREVMTRQTAQDCVDVLRRSAIPTVDITGGAPELNPSFRWLVEECRALGRHVINRCNLTVLETATHAGPSGLLREPRRRARVFVAPLRTGLYRRPAGERCVREEHSRASTTQRGRLRRRRIRPSVGAGDQPGWRAATGPAGRARG